MAELFRRHGGAVCAAATLCERSVETACKAAFLALWRDPEQFEPTGTTVRTRLLVFACADRAEIDLGAGGGGGTVTLEAGAVFAVVSQSDGTYREVARALGVATPPVLRVVRETADQLRSAVTAESRAMAKPATS